MSGLASNERSAVADGSVLLSETDLRVNTIGFLAHDLVVLLDPADIVENVHLAYRHPAFRNTAYSVLASSRYQDRAGKSRKRNASENFGME
jgi:hypothetical protein